MKDSLQHMVVGFLLALCSALLFGIPWAVAIVLVVAIGKEVYDIYKSPPTGISFGDLLATILGGGFGVLLVRICLRG